MATPFRGGFFCLALLPLRIACLYKETYGVFMKYLRLVNILLFLAALLTAIGIALYALPTELQYSETMADLHRIAGLSFFILAIIHITLNWSWIRSQILGKKKGKK